MNAVPHCAGHSVGVMGNTSIYIKASVLAALERFNLVAYYDTAAISL